ncbi:MAG TPA: HAMP domain-containing sensor histidine kinase [Terriglobales bacterium]
MNFSRSSRIWLFGVCALMCAQGVASFWLARSFALVALSDLTQLILLCSATAALIYTAVKSRGRARLFWILMATGVALWLTYQVLWSYFEVFMRTEVPNPFGGDVVLFLHLVPMMAAVAVQPHRDQSDHTPRTGTLDFALLLLWWLYLYLFTVIPWQYVFNNETVYEHNLNIVYLIEKVALLVGLALLWSRARGLWKIIYFNWFCATLTYALSSYLANWAIEKEVYFSGSIYDVPLALSMAWVTLIALMSLQPHSEPLVECRSAAQGVWIARVGMICVSSLPLFAVFTMFNDAAPAPVREFRLVVTLGTMLVMGILVSVRQHLLDHELLRLLAGSREALDHLNRVQTQLVQSEKLASLGQLVGGAAHELNNPLTAIMGYSELLSATPLSTEQRNLAQKIDQQVRRTRTLVSSLLSFAKQTPGEKALLDMNSLVQTAVKLAPPQLRSHHIQIRTQLATELPKVRGDSNQLLQVCLHVTSNALHAMENGGGVLTVSSSTDKATVVVEFSDEGPGIEQPERVFDPFYTTRPVGQGAGLGLSACYGIIQEHKGRITCQNRPKGGATFRIELPAVAVPAELARTATQ